MQQSSRGSRSPNHVSLDIDIDAESMYYSTVMFIWDDENIVHIARHGVAPQEAEEVLTHEGTIVAPARGRRFSGYGTTATGRPLRVIYDLIGQDGIRVTTAYPIRRRDFNRIRQEASHD